MGRFQYFFRHCPSQGAYEVFKGVKELWEFRQKVKGKCFHQPVSIKEISSLEVFVFFLQGLMSYNLLHIPRTNSENRLITFTFTHLRFLIGVLPATDSFRLSFHS